VIDNEMPISFLLMREFDRTAYLRCVMNKCGI